MNLAILNTWDNNLLSLVALTWPNVMEYCNRWGYKALGIHSETLPGTDCIWARIHAIKQHLADYDWIVVTDCDAVIMNHTIPFEKFLQRDLIVTHNHSGINTGVFAFRNTPWFFRFIDNWIDQGRYLSNHIPWCKEQWTLAHCLFAQPLDKWTVIPDKQINCHYYQYYPDLANRQVTG